MSQESFAKADFKIDPDAIEARFTNDPPRPQGQIKVDTAMENVAAYYGQDPVTMVERPAEETNQSKAVKQARMNDEEVSLGDQVLINASESLTSDHTRTTHPIVQDAAAIAFGAGALAAVGAVMLGVGETINFVGSHPSEALMAVAGGMAFLLSRAVRNHSTEARNAFATLAIILAAISAGSTAGLLRPSEVFPQDPSSRTTITTEPTSTPVPIKLTPNSNRKP